MNGPSEVCFDGWTLRRASGELVRDGKVTRLPQQPLTVLLELVDRPGEVVTRERLIEALWPKGTVDFDNGLNATVRKLRVALNDNSEVPRYIETLPRIGYRFVAPLLQPASQPALNELQPNTQPAPGSRANSRIGWLVVGGVTFGLLAVGAWFARNEITRTDSVQSTQTAPLTARRTTSVRAYELYLQGIFERGRRDIIGNAKAIDNFRAAIEADPHYAEAWSGLADALMASAIGQALPTLPTLREADQAARRAVELNGSLAETHASLGHVHMLLNHDFASAEAEFARALELNDGYARLWHLIGILRGHQGRGEEALAAMRRARELEPMTLLFNANYGLILYHLRRYDEAIAHLEPLIESQPALIQSRSVLLRAHIAKGNIPAARQQLELMEGGSPNLSDAGLFYAHAGQRDAALAEVTRLLKRREQGFAVGYELAIVYAALGELPKGCAELETALIDGSPFLGWLKLDPRLDPLRNQPCFARVEHELFK